MASPISQEQEDFQRDAFQLHPPARAPKLVRCAVQLKVLAEAKDHVKHYARGLGATRREWANANEDLVVRFTRAMIRASDWLQDAKNKDAVIELLLGETKNNKARAVAMYESTLSPTMGLTPRSRVDMEGIRTVIELRETAGLMKPPVPKPEKYVDERFYKKALATLAR